MQNTKPKEEIKTKPKEVRFLEVPKTPVNTPRVIVEKKPEVKPKLKKYGKPA